MADSSTTGLPVQMASKNENEAIAPRAVLAANSSLTVRGEGERRRSR